MPFKLKNTIGRALRVPIRRPADPVHFHLASDGRAFVCDVDACDSAAVTLGELQSSALYVV
jgi:hypothetical protein